MKQRTLHIFLSIISLSVMLCLLTVSAVADTIDLTSMSDAEIISLLGIVNQEIVDRGIQKTAKLAKGTYIVGKDIPVGSYIFTCLAAGNDWGNVSV